MTLRSSILACFSVIAIASVGCGDSTSTGGGGSGASQSTGGGGGENVGGDPSAGCTLLTQTTDGTTLSSIGAVGFEFEPSMGDSSIPDVISVSPGNIGLVPTGTVDVDGLDGTTIVFASVDAVVDLINAPFDAMDGRLFVAVSGQVTIEDAPDEPTQFKGRVKGSVSGLRFLELDSQFDVITDGDCFFLEAGDFDAASWVEDCDAPVDVANTPSGGACIDDWAEIGHSCNPVNNDGCLSTQICDWGGYFKCYDIVGDEVGLCGACENLEGPHCQVGMTCDSDGANGKCYRYCCTDADCGAGATCIAYSFAPTGVGVCLTQ